MSVGLCTTSIPSVPCNVCGNFHEPWKTPFPLDSCSSSPGFHRAGHTGEQEDRLWILFHSLTSDFWLDGSPSMASAVIPLVLRAGLIFPPLQIPGLHRFWLALLPLSIFNQQFVHHTFSNSSECAIHFLLQTWQFLPRQQNLGVH